MDIYDRIETLLIKNKMTKADLAIILDMPYTTLASLFAKFFVKQS